MSNRGLKSDLPIFNAFKKANLGNSSMPKQAIHTNDAPAAIGAYSQAIKAGGTVYISGQIPLDPSTGELVSDDICDQIHQVFKNMRAVAAAADGT